MHNDKNDNKAPLSLDNFIHCLELVEVIIGNYFYFSPIFLEVAVPKLIQTWLYLTYTHSNINITMMKMMRHDTIF